MLLCSPGFAFRPELVHLISKLPHIGHMGVWENREREF
jgi:hypothetical protein